MNTTTRWYTNISKVPIGGKMPGEDFPLSIDQDGNVLDSYWRKRIKERAVTPKETSTPAASSSRESEAKKTVKKGRSE